jgi:tetratricopeptide (TPR) repeat protein
MTSGRLRALALVSLLAVYCGLSFRRVAESGEVVVRDSPFLKTSARVLPPGWHFVPAGLLAVYRYAEGDQRLDLLLDAAHALPLKSRDDSPVGIDLRLTYRVVPERALDLHRLLGPAFEAGWLTPKLVAAAREEVGRNGIQELSGSNRARLERALLAGVRREVGESAGVTVEKVEVWRVVPGDLPASRVRGSLAPIAGARVLFIGLDGADWNLIDPLIAAGKMPNLAALLRSGVRARLRTISPVLSPVIWTTVATGKLPSKHGIVDFLAVDSRTGKRVPVTSNLRRTKAIWNILGESGVPVGTIAWWATWPAEKVNGFLVTERIAYQLFGMGKEVDAGSEGKVFPPELYAQVEALRVKPEEIEETEVRRFLALPPTGLVGLPAAQRDRAEEFRTVLAGTRTYAAIAERLFAEHPTPFRAVYFEGIDTTSHLFMQYRRPRLSWVAEQDAAWFGGAVDRFYEYQDTILGELLGKFGGDDVNVVIASDHGFRSDTNRPKSDAGIQTGKAAEWHRKYGVLVLAGPAFRPGATIEEASVADITPTILAAFGLPTANDMDGEVLATAFRPEFLAAHPLGTLRTFEDPAAPVDGVNPVASEADDAIVAKLTALGYVSQAGSNSHNNRGLLLLNESDFDGAIEEFRAALETEPEFLVARVNMGRALMLQGNNDEALGVFEDVLRRDSGLLEVENFVGNIYMEKKDYRSAETHLRRAVAIDPANADAHNSLGILYEREERWDEAIAEYRRVTEIDPEYGEGYNNLGNVYKKRGRAVEAEAMYRRAIEADPSFVGSYNNLALLFQEQGRIDAAIDYYRRAVERAPDHPQVRLNLGSLFYAQGKLEEAKAEFKRAIELDPGYAEAHNNLGAVYGQLKEYEAEQEELRKAVELDPTYADARHNLGLAYLRAGQDERGIDELRRAIELQPGYLSALVNLGAALCRRGRNAEGIPYLERGLGINPAMPAVHNTLAVAYLAIGRREDGIAQLRASLQLVPDQPQIRQRLTELGG